MWAIPAEESARHDRLNVDRERLGPVNLGRGAGIARDRGGPASRDWRARELTQAVNRLRGFVGSLNREGRLRSLQRSSSGSSFPPLFARLFEGGEAYLQLIDSDDPLEAGLEIMASRTARSSAPDRCRAGEQAPRRWR